jgi:hypothetical protein
MGEWSDREKKDSLYDGEKIPNMSSAIYFIYIFLCLGMHDFSFRKRKHPIDRLFRRMHVHIERIVPVQKLCECVIVEEIACMRGSQRAYIYIVDPGD